MVEISDLGQGLGCDRAAFRIDDYIVRIHADVVRHKNGQSGLVFAVSVGMDEDVGGGVRLPATDSQLDCKGLSLPVR